MAHEHVDEIVAAIKSRTDELEAKGISESDIISVAYAYFGVMLAKRVDQRHAVNLANWTLKELERLDSGTDRAVLDLKGMAATMRRIVGESAGGVAQRVAGLLRRSPKGSPEAIAEETSEDEPETGSAAEG